jgi:hypothetical protein
MKTLVRAVAAMAAISAVLSCSGPTEPEHQSFVYPLELGNQWTYQYTQIRIFDGDTQTDTIQYLYNAAVVRVDTVLPGILLYEVQESFTDELGYDFEGMRAYINLPDGMYIYCDGGSGWNPVLLKPSGGSNETDRIGYPSGSLHELSESVLFPLCSAGEGQIEYYDPVRLALPYPQKIGYRWTYVDSADAAPFGIEKEIEGWQTVSTPAGSFNCTSIGWYYTASSLNIDITTLVSAQGLVRRSVIFYDIEITGYSYPYGTGETADYYQTWELIEYQLN